MVPNSFISKKKKEKKKKSNAIHKQYTFFFPYLLNCQIFIEYYLNLQATIDITFLPTTYHHINKYQILIL